MFEINYKHNNIDIVIQAESNHKLRDILIENNVYPYNGNAKYLNCRGLGTCGTCAVTIIDSKDNYNYENLKTIEKIRLDFLPNSKNNTIENKLRLSCQYVVDSDISVIKNDGFWGQK